MTLPLQDPQTDAARVRSSLVKVCSGWAPPPDLKISEFSDQHIVVTSGPLKGTRWDTSMAPYERGILDAFHELGVQIVVVMGSSQWGKTACAVNIVSYHIAHDPCSILVILPTVEPMAKDFAKNRLDPTIEATPILSDAVSKKRAKDATNTTLEKTFRGGMVALAGANSAASLAARPVRLLVGDEIDRWPRELPGEGSTIAIAMKRTQSFKTRKRILLLSSPTIEDAPIDAWYKRGDQRRYYVPCPACGHMHAFEWANVKWEDEDASTARLHCPACDYAMSDVERQAVLPRGEWRSTNPKRRDKTVISFHIWEAYSPFSSLTGIVSAFLAAREKQREGDDSEMHTFENTTLGQPVARIKGAGAVDSNVLLERREQYLTEDVDVPAGACCLTLGVDVQDDRLEALVVAWGPGEESWLVDRQTLPGDTSQPDPWDQLDELLDVQYRHELGTTLMIQAACVDSAGHRTTLVYDYAERQAARKVYAVIGRDGDRPIVSSPSQKRWGRKQRKVPLYTIGVDASKSLFMSRLKVTEKGRGHVHLPHVDWCDEELVAQFVSEKLVTKWHKGVPMQAWVKTRRRNEGLDLFVYAHAALRLLNAKLPQMLQRLQADASQYRRNVVRQQAESSSSVPPAVAQRPGRRVGRSSYLGR